MARTTREARPAAGTSSVLSAELVLAAVAAASVAIYWLAFVRPFDLLRQWQQPLLDLQKISATQPQARIQLLWAFAAEGLLYYIGWEAAKRARGRRAWAIVVGGALAAGLVLLFSTPYDAADIFDNIVHGRILGVYGFNPFVQVGGQFPQDPFIRYMAWPGSPSAYGPFWEVLAAVTARLAGDGIIANVIAFKLVGGLFIAGCAAVVGLILRDLAPERILPGVLLLAWNPIILYETIGHGHNDIVMMFWVLVAVRSMSNRSYTLAILSLLAGALVKFIPLLFLPAAGLLALRDLPDARARLRFVAVTALLSVGLVVLAYGSFWHGPQTLTIDRRENMLTTSLPAFVWAWLQQQGAGVDPGILARTISRAAALLTAGFALIEALRAWRDRSWLSLPRSILHVSLFYLMITCVWFQNWYAVWPLAVAALLPADRDLALAQVFGFASLSKPLVFAPVVLWRSPFPAQVWRELRLGPAVMAVPWFFSLYAMLAAWRSRRLTQRRPASAVIHTHS